MPHLPVLPAGYDWTLHADGPGVVLSVAPTPGDSSEGRFLVSGHVNEQRVYRRFLDLDTAMKAAAATVRAVKTLRDREAALRAETETALFDLVGLTPAAQETDAWGKAIDTDPWAQPPDEAGETTADAG